MQNWDGWLHVNPHSHTDEVGVAMIFNPTDMVLNRTVTLPLYYTGIESDDVYININENNDIIKMKINRDYTINIALLMKPKTIHTIVLMKQPMHDDDNNMKKRGGGIKNIGKKRNTPPPTATTVNRTVMAFISVDSSQWTKCQEFLSQGGKAEGSVNAISVDNLYSFNPINTPMFTKNKVNIQKHNKIW